MAVLLWAVTCGHEAVIAGDVPIACPTCGVVTLWATSPPYTLTVNDERFLRSIHIAHGKTD